jgi:hypothetical protein
MRRQACTACLVLRRGPRGVKIIHAENHAKLPDSQPS